MKSKLWHTIKGAWARPICIKCKVAKATNPFAQPFCVNCYADHLYVEDKLKRERERKERVNEIVEAIKLAIPAEGSCKESK